MNVLLIDFEATSVDARTARILEIGAMITDEKFVCNPILGMSQLVWEPGYPALTPEVAKVTNLTTEMLVSEGIPARSAFIDLARIADSAKPAFVIAYNSIYDYQLFLAECARNNVEDWPGIRHLMSVPWLCAMTDIETNYQFKSWRLMHVALEYGVTVNPKELHRALADVELTRKMLEASGTSPTEMFEFQQEPWIFVQAITKKPWEDGSKSNDIAKSLGFRWQRAAGSEREFKNQWVKRIKQRHLAELQKTTLKIVRID